MSHIAPLHPPQQHKHDRRTYQSDENLPKRIASRTLTAVSTSQTLHLMLQLDKSLSTRSHAPCTMLVGQYPRVHVCPRTRLVCHVLTWHQ